MDFRLTQQEGKVSFYRNARFGFDDRLLQWMRAVSSDDKSVLEGFPS